MEKEIFKILAEIKYSNREDTVESPKLETEHTVWAMEVPLG